MSFRSSAVEKMRDLIDFSKKRTGLDAVIFYVFYLGCFALITAVMNNGL